MQGLPFVVVFLMTWAMTSHAAADQFVIIHGKATPALSAGDVVGTDSQLSIAAGITLTLIDSDGRKIRIAGPFDGSIRDLQLESGAGKVEDRPSKSGAASLNVVKAIAGLLRQAASESADRAIPLGRQMSDPWLINVSVADHHCVKALQSARFWRSNFRDSDRFVLETRNLRQRAGIPWPAGTDELDWPLEVEFEDGGSYLMQTSRINPRPFTIHVVPDSLPTRAHQAAWMADRACKEQALLLVLTADVDLFVNDLAKKGRF